MTDLPRAPSTPSTSPTGWNETAARDWLAGPTSSASEALRRPWQVAATVIGLDEAGIGSVLDVASGPGGFLQLLLGEFPQARGVWLDSSEVMRDEARSRLAELGGRVEYHVGDILELEKACAPGSADVVTTSRATHHLTVPDLGRFYEQAAAVLRSGSWVANLDNVTMGGEWDGRLRAARTKLRGPQAAVAPSHPHVHRSPTIEEHLSALRAAGFTDPAVIWQEFVSVLVMARRS
jgi:SAM-dependent methyltransferase